MSIFTNFTADEAKIAKTLQVSGLSSLLGGLTTGNGKVKIFQKIVTLADEAEVSLPDATAGFVVATDGTESIIAYVGIDGAVLDIVTSTNAVAADTDGNLCIYDGGTAANVKNHLGSEATVSILYVYFV